MSEKKIIDIIKGAILLEYRGKALYESVVKTTEIEGVRGLFAFLGEEEERHIEILENQYLKLKKNEKITLADIKSDHYETSEEIISGNLIDEISGAGYEAAVIAAALEFEKNAVIYYSHHSESSNYNEEKKLYKWLAEWEKKHLAMLAELDKEIKEQIWFDNKFWPI